MSNFGDDRPSELGLVAEKRRKKENNDSNKTEEPASQHS